MEIFKKNNLLKTIKVNKQATFIFEYKDGHAREDIEKVITSCSCSNATFVNEGVKIVYSDNSKNKANEYPGGYRLVTKSAKVYLKDGQPMYIKGPKGQIPNPNKKKINIRLNTVVEF